LWRSALDILTFLAGKRGIRFRCALLIPAAVYLDRSGSHRFVTAATGSCGLPSGLQAIPLFESDRSAQSAFDLGNHHA
jgi:hypothetical protein